MAPNADIISISPTPAFTAKILALPAINEAVNRALDAFDSTKNRNDAMGAALRAAEASMRVAASGALPLATPIVNTVGGWGVVDQWACSGLDRVEKVAPIIKKPTKEIITTTRQTMLKAVAGGDGAVPASLAEAITTRANNAVDIMANTRGGLFVMNSADQAIVSVHTVVDNYLPPQKGDKQGKGVPAGGFTIKISALVTKIRQRLYQSVYIIIRPPTDKAIDGTITIALLIAFTRRTATDLYEEVLREPKKGEVQSATMALARATVKLTIQANGQLMAVVQKQFDSLKTMDREAVTKLLQDLWKTSMDRTVDVRFYVSGAATVAMGVANNLYENAVTYRLYYGDMLRKAMSDYELRDRANRAATAAQAWRMKNEMVRVASPPQSPPPEETVASPPQSPPPKETVKSKIGFGKKK